MVGIANLALLFTRKMLTRGCIGADIVARRREGVVVIAFGQVEPALIAIIFVISLLEMPWER